jgi:hypothetical protein
LLERAPGEIATDLVDDDAWLDDDVPLANHGALEAEPVEGGGLAADVDTAPAPAPAPVPPPVAAWPADTASVRAGSPTARPAEPSWPETRSWPPRGAEMQPARADGDQRPRAGAYLPPSALLTSVDDHVPLAPAPAVGPAPAPAVGPAPSQASGASASDGPSIATRLGGGLPALSATAPSQVVLAGAVMAGLGFLLPWADIVIGSRSIGGYLAQWGLAGPGHIGVLLALVILAAVALAHDRLPGWVRPGVPALIIAGLLAGLAWPYVVGGLQPAIGVYLTLVGGFVLGIGALIDLWVGRHATGSRGV